MEVHIESQKSSETTKLQTIDQKQDGTLARNKQELITRWTEWVEHQFHTTENNIRPETMHMQEQQWENGENTDTDNEKQITQVRKALQSVRQDPTIAKLINQYPQIAAWLTKNYTDKDTKKAIRGLKNGKSHGIDGVPGEAYKVSRKHLTQPIRILMNKIKQGQELPTQWTKGTIVHIYKNKGDIHECGPYRPICLIQITYKIWSSLTTQRLTQIMHILTQNTHNTDIRQNYRQ